MRLIPRLRRNRPTMPAAADGRCQATTRAGARCKLTAWPRGAAPARAARQDRVMYASPEPVLLASNARAADRPMACVLCPRPVEPGDRVADLADGRGPAHLGCASRSR